LRLGGGAIARNVARTRHQPISETEGAMTCKECGREMPDHPVLIAQTTEHGDWRASCVIRNLDGRVLVSMVNKPKEEIAAQIRDFADTSGNNIHFHHVESTPAPGAPGQRLGDAR
jgi:hypothetical protein